MCVCALCLDVFGTCVCVCMCEWTCLVVSVLVRMYNVYVRVGCV